MSDTLHAVILAGGSGTRFWPESRRSFPKQFLTLSGGRTMLQTTVDRCLPWISWSNIWVVTNSQHADEVSRELPELPPSQVILEPCGRNTAPCIALAAAQLLERDPQAIMLVLPSDHVIQPVALFQESVLRATSIISASPDTFVLFGVPPTFPATGYGYIQRQQASSYPGAFQVQSFREKPTRPIAEQYLKDGGYFWNCGIFLWQARAILNAVKAYQPEIHDCLQQIEMKRATLGWPQAIDIQFPEMPSISIDYAVLEKAQGVIVFEAPFAWDDVGSWLALQRLLGDDAMGNTISGLHCGVSTQNCIIRTTDQHLVATMGADNLIIVHTPDATLIASRDREDSLRTLIDELRRRGLDGFL